MFWTVSATANPRPRLGITSIGGYRLGQIIERKAERINKNADGKDDEHGRQRNGFRQPKLRAGPGRQQPSARRAKRRDRAARSAGRTGTPPPQSRPAARRESAEAAHRPSTSERPISIPPGRQAGRRAAAGNSPAPFCRRVPREYPRAPRMATAAKPQNITPDQKSFGARILMLPLTPSALPSDDQIG